MEKAVQSDIQVEQERKEIEKENNQFDVEIKKLKEIINKKQVEIKKLQQTKTDIQKKLMVEATSRIEQKREEKQLIKSQIAGETKIIETKIVE